MKKMHLVSCGLAMTFVGSAWGSRYYSNPTNVNVARRYDFFTQSINPGASISESNTIDGSGFHNGNFASNPMTLTYNFGEARPMGELNLRHLSWSYARDFTLETSATGFGSMSTVLNVANHNSLSYTGTFAPQVARYVRYTGSNPAPQANGWQVLNEMRIEAPAGAQIHKHAGYDLLDDPAVATIAYTSGINGGDTPSRLSDNEISTYIRYQNSSGQFVLSFDDSYRLGAAHFGFFNSQQWDNGITIWTSNDVAMPDPNNNSLWTQQWSLAPGIGTGQNELAVFSKVGAARHLRVTVGQTFGALVEFEVFAVPEPASLGLLALGAVAGLRRRR